MPATPQPLVTKFVRYFDAPFMGGNGSMFGLWLRLVYEFWGFCVNGTDDLKHPGGFPTGSAPNIHMSGVINMPAGWESGSNILIYSNSDGITNEGMPYFTGSNFTSAMVGKWLTVWKSGSSCTDDSIYLITRLYAAPGVTTSSVIGVDNNMGCTPFTGTLKPAFTARTNVNYRVIDYNPINQTHTIQNFIVIQLNGAPYVNSGQRNSQVRLRLATFRGDTFPRGIAIWMSPSGSWSGNTFNDGTSGGNSQTFQPNPNSGEFGPYSGNSFDWNNGGNGTQTLNIFGAQDWLLCFSRGDQASYSAHFHVEIPQRIYPREYDPNPIVGMGSTGIYTTFSDAYGYGYGHLAYGADLKPYKHALSIRCQSGETYNNNPYPGISFVCSNCLQSMGNGFHNHMWFNPFTNKFFFSDGVLHLAEAANRSSIMRYRLRRTRFIAPIIPSMQRLGDRGEWLHTFNGVLWQWDNAILPSTIFHRGG